MNYAIIIAAIISLSVAIGMITLSILFGPKSRNSIKEENFECGMTKATKDIKSLSINFYLIAVLFLIIDIEIIYLYPYASYFNTISKKAFIGGIFFITILLFTVFYIIKRGAIKWD